MDQPSGPRPAQQQVVADDVELIVGASPDVITVAGLDGVLHYVSPPSRRLFGWDPAQLEGRRWSGFVHPEDHAKLRLRNGNRRAGHGNTSTYRVLCRDGTFRWVEATTRRVLLARYGAAMDVSAVREVDERQEQLTAEHKAFTDPPTGVANRTLLMDRLRHGLRRLGRASDVLGVLYLDLDRLKVLHDSLGHRVGDAVLVQVAERLGSHIRPADTLARLGGDEFVIVAEGLSGQPAALELANRVITACRSPLHVGAESITCTVSIGIACTTDPQHNADGLLHEADLALHQARSGGGDRAEVFDEALRTRAVGRLVGERRLRRALSAGQLVVEYQPIVALPSGRPVGAEALVRIRDDAGLHLPATFLDIAEEAGLLTAIDEHVLLDALRHLARWHTRLRGMGFADVAINMSARHLADAGFHETLLSLLDAHDLPHAALQVEVTERVLMEASHAATNGLRVLREAGVQVGLDDFGAGYASLAYLRRLPLDYVKLDRSFIEDLEHANGSVDVVKAVVGLAHALGLSVVAEGVETPGQRRILEDVGSDRAQGLLFGPAAAATSIDRMALATPD